MRSTQQFTRARASFARILSASHCVQVNTDESLKVYDVLRADKIVVEAPALDAITRRYTKLSQDRSSKRDLKKGQTRGSYKDLLAIKAGYTGGKRKPELRRGGGGGGGGSAAAPAEEAPAEAAKAGEAAE